MRKHILSSILSVFILLFVVSPSHAIVTYNCNSLTGGTSRSLDYISIGDLSNGDRAIVYTTNNETLFFKYDASGVTAENTSGHPYTVRPDDFVSAGVWVEYRITANSGKVYYVDPDNADSGVTGNGRTIKALATTIGTTERATLYFSNSGSGVTEGYTVTTAIDLSSYPYLNLEFENGAQIDGTGGVTPYSPANIKAQPGQQIKSGTGAFVFANGGMVQAPWFGFGETGNTAAQNGDAMDAAMDSISGVTGGIVNIPIQGTISFDNFTLDADVTLQGVGKDSTVLQSTYAGNCVTLSMDSVIKDLTIDGVSHVAGSIGVYGSSVNRTHLENMLIKNFEINEYRQSGIKCEWLNVVNTSGTTGFVVYTDGANVFAENKYIGGEISGSTVGLYMEYAGKAISHNYFQTDFEGNGIGVILKGTYGTRFQGPSWFESNTTNHIEIYDVGTQYNTTMVMDHVILNTLVGGGIYSNSLNLNMDVRSCFLNSHTWNLASGAARYINFDNCYENGMTYSGSNRIVRRSPTNSWPQNINLPQTTSTTNAAYETINIIDGSQDRRFAYVTTTDATETSLFSFTISDEKAYLIEWSILGQSSDGSHRAGYQGSTLAYRDGGGATIESADSGTTTFQAESAAAFDATCDVSANTVRLRVTGDSGVTMYWTGALKLLVR